MQRGGFPVATLLLWLFDTGLRAIVTWGAVDARTTTRVAAWSGLGGGPAVGVRATCEALSSGLNHGAGEVIEEG